MERRESWDRWSATLRPAHWSWFICLHLSSLCRIHTVFSQTAIQKFLSFVIKFSRYFRPLSSYLQNPIHALAISGVIRSFKSTLASTNNSFALFKLQNSSYLFPKTDGSTFTMVFIIVDATIHVLIS